MSTHGDAAPSRPTAVAFPPERSAAGWVRALALPGDGLPDADWERHHAIVLRILGVATLAVALYAAMRGAVPGYVLGYAIPMLALLLAAATPALARGARAVAAALGLMTASASAVLAAQGATEAHFLFFALLPLAALYGARAPFVAAVAFVALFHFVAGSIAPERVFGDAGGNPLGVAALHGAPLLAETVVCLLVWRVAEDRRQLVERAMDELALRDPLTGLANRTSMHDRIIHALSFNGTRTTAVLMVDLDEFKTINDVSGHAVGDAVLMEVARRISRSTRPPDTVARLGGDEFVVLLQDAAGPSAAATVAERMLGELSAPVVIGGQQFLVTASIGITLSDGTDGRGATELVRDADIAMYASKSEAKGGYRLFEAAMHDRVVADTALVGDLRAAIEKDQLRVLYQPQVDLASGRLTGVEALVRWEHPEHGLITPDRFIPLAERTGTIAGLDEWVLRQACGQLRRWDDVGIKGLEMAVNVSGRRLVNGDLAATIARVTREAGIDAARLELEITETAAVSNEDDAVEVITRVRELGTRVAIDDFGMGYSAFSRLQSFPVDRLKIDRSFVTPLTHGAARGSIADAMIAIGQSLGLHVLAEGVETREHVRALRALGCRSGQGYLFSRPVGPDEIAVLARAGSLIDAEETPARVPSVPVEPSSVTRERMIRNLLAELQRVTGLETTYLTRIDWETELQHVTHARNAGSIEISEGLSVDWADTVCRRALEQGVTYTDDVPSVFADSEAARQLGLQTYVSVPLRNDGGIVQGTLCGASSQPLALGDEAMTVMERFARLITDGFGHDQRPHTPAPGPLSP